MDLTYNLVENILGILMATVVYQVIGFCWYSNWAFGKVWLEETGLNEAQLKEMHPWMPYVIGWASALVLAYVIDRVHFGMGGSHYFDGILVGLLLSLGIAAATAPHYAFGNKSRKLWTLDQCQTLLAMIVMGAIIGAGRNGWFGL